MLNYTGHPFVDVGIATITAFAEKNSPVELTIEDLDRIADYMEQNYIVDPLKSFLNVAFPNSGFTNPAFEKTPEKRREYARKILRAYKPGRPQISGQQCIFTGTPAVAVSFDLNDKLPMGRAFRQHIPLTTGEDVINFAPYGNAGLPLSGLALLAIHALPLGCAKVSGRLLAVHADNPEYTLKFAKRFLEQNRRNIHSARQKGDKKLAEGHYRMGTMLIDTLINIESTLHDTDDPVSISAYHFSNSGQGADLQVFHLPLEIIDFIADVHRADYADKWHKIVQRGWQLSVKKISNKEPDESFQPSFNVLYEDLLLLPENSRQFIRRYFLRTPTKTRRADDPRGFYSITSDADIVSWSITELFLRKVMLMTKERIALIREFGDRLAEYVYTENDTGFFNQFLRCKDYFVLRAVLIKLSVKLLKANKGPIISFDAYVDIFECGVDLPYSDWRLAKDLVLIRMVERLHELGWIQRNVDEIADSGELEE